MRDNLIHEYDDIDLNEVWKTAERDIPELLTLLEPLHLSSASHFCDEHKCLGLIFKRGLNFEQLTSA